MLAMVGARGFALAANRARGGVYCGPDGVFAGTVPLLKRAGTPGAWSVRPLVELNDELSTCYRLPVDIAAKANALSLIAHALNRGDLAMAAIATVQMQLPDPPLAKGVEGHDQLVRRAAALHRSGLLKWEWDSLKHPRLGTAPNPGWFASTGRVEDSSSSVQTTSGPAVQLVADPIGGKRPFGDTSNFPTGGGGGGGTVRVFGPGGLFDGPPDYDGGPNVIRPLQEGSTPAPREVSPRSIAPVETQPGQELPAIEPPPTAEAETRPTETVSPAPAAHAASANQSTPPKIGSFLVPDDLTFGTTDFGNYAHNKMAELLKELYPGVDFTFRVGRGQKGVDTDVPEDASVPPLLRGKSLELKPRTPSGERSFYRQQERWGVPVEPLTYDQDGNIYYGFR
jgi:hypothetical protein